MLIGKPAPFVSAFVAAMDEAIRMHQPNCGLSAIQRAWLAFCVTAVLVTNSICWARFERASLGTYSLAALSSMFRHSKMPWDQLLVASVRVILRHHGLTAGSLVIDDTDNPRSKSAKALAYLYKLRDKESGGYLWGQSLVFLGFCRKVRFLGKIQKLGVRDSRTYRPPNSRKNNFATEPTTSLCPLRPESRDATCAHVVSTRK
ncbi:MAG TPA: hypothetical protein VLQ80_30795 [Candidatus Saccharimonadia bacterium]|nr:hypothetical protein [Candidatus Saccharimonadia bacterium]